MVSIWNRMKNSFKSLNRVVRYRWERPVPYGKADWEADSTSSAVQVQASYMGTEDVDKWKETLHDQAHSAPKIEDVAANGGATPSTSTGSVETSSSPERLSRAHLSDSKHPSAPHTTTASSQSHSYDYTQKRRVP